MKVLAKNHPDQDYINLEFQIVHQGPVIVNAIQVLNESTNTILLTIDLKTKWTELYTQQDTSLDNIQLVFQEMEREGRPYNHESTIIELIDSIDYQEFLVSQTGRYTHKLVLILSDAQ